MLLNRLENLWTKSCASKIKTYIDKVGHRLRHCRGSSHQCHMSKHISYAKNAVLYSTDGFAYETSSWWFMMTVKI